MSADDLPRRHVSRLERFSLKGYADSEFLPRAWPSLNITNDQRACSDHAFILHLR